MIPQLPYWWTLLHGSPTHIGISPMLYVFSSIPRLALFAILPVSSGTMLVGPPAQHTTCLNARRERISARRITPTDPGNTYKSRSSRTPSVLGPMETKRKWHLATIIEPTNHHRCHIHLLPARNSKTCLAPKYGCPLSKHLPTASQRVYLVRMA
jgi:hypothetical protein